MESPYTIKNKLKYGFSLFLLTTLVFFIDFIAFVLSSNVSSSMDMLSWAYYIVTALGHAALFAAILYIIIYIPFALILKNYKITTIIYSVFAILLQVVLLIDIFVFDIYKFHINGFVIDLILGGAATDIFVFDWALYLKFALLVICFAIAPFVIISLITLRKNYKYLKPKYIKLSCILLITCVVFSHLGHAVAYAAKQFSIQKSATALPLFFPLTANSLLLKWGIIDVDQMDSITSGKVSSDLQYPKNPIVASDSIPGYNIIYIYIDSWNPRTLDSITSPNMAEFSQKGQIFNKHLSSSNGTRGSIFGSFFGVSFTYEKEFYMSRISPVILDRLLEKDYDIEVFPSANFTSPPFHDIIFKRVPGIRTRGKGNSPKERDEDITNEFVKFAHDRTNDKPFFAFLFYDLPHAMVIPKDLPKKFQPSWNAPAYMELKNDMDPTPFFNLYKNCVYQTDMLIGKVLIEIEAKGMMDNSIIVITGDHGQEFNENKKNYWGHNGNFSKWQIQVPLIVYYPGIESGKTFTHTTTHYDISPTILSRFLGIQNPFSDYSMAFDLWDNADRYPHIVGDHVNYGFVMHDAIVTSSHTGKTDMYDLEMNNISRDKINLQELSKAIEKKNMFYK